MWRNKTMALTQKKRKWERGFLLEFELKTITNETNDKRYLLIEHQIKYLNFIPTDSLLNQLSCILPASL